MRVESIIPRIQRDKIAYIAGILTIASPAYAETASETDIKIAQPFTIEDCEKSPVTQANVKSLTETQLEQFLERSLSCDALLTDARENGQCKSSSVRYIFIREDDGSPLNITNEITCFNSKEILKTKPQEQLEAQRRVDEYLTDRSRLAYDGDTKYPLPNRANLDYK